MMAQWGVAVAALIVGLGAGYYYGGSVGRARGVADGVAQEKQAQADRTAAAEREAAKAVNPFEQAAGNPLGNTSANPFENVKVNPFK
ncbi:MAG: hypothetical protein Greene071436_307 [Parcubacteria group bacterium Greene0714_36]|nr:MAG: hypothetical protein Greene071436_307 [Parcubacteria group bacterium Greene0714_36]